MHDYQQLAAVLLGLNPDEVADDDWESVEEQFADKYGFGIGEIEDLLQDLLKLVIPQTHPLGGTYQFFARQDPNNPQIWDAIYRREYQPPQGNSDDAS